MEWVLLMMFKKVLNVMMSILIVLWLIFLIPPYILSILIANQFRKIRIKIRIKRELKKFGVPEDLMIDITRTYSNFLKVFKLRDLSRAYT
jgi:hypothetical protein